MVLHFPAHLSSSYNVCIHQLNMFVCLCLFYLCLQTQITVNNYDMIIIELTNIVHEVNDADQSTANLEVIATVFTNTTRLIASGSISISNTVSI